MGLFNRIKTNNTVRKDFNYIKGKVSLSFSLRTDVKHELKDFWELLREAKREVEKELKAHE